MKRAKDNILIMGPEPIHRGVEVTPEVAGRVKFEANGGI